MKKFKTGIVALALVFGISSAFVSKISAAPKDPEPTYDWVDDNGQNPITNKTESFANTAYDCSQGQQTCAIGTLRLDSPAPGDQNVTLHKPQN